MAGFLQAQNGAAGQVRPRTRAPEIRRQADTPSRSEVDD
jgi:hypothetical protein